MCIPHDICAPCRHQFGDVVEGNMQTQISKIPLLNGASKGHLAPTDGGLDLQPQRTRCMRIEAVQMMCSSLAAYPVCTAQYQLQSPSGEARHKPDGNSSRMVGY
jgi:hypothetical protein